MDVTMPDGTVIQNVPDGTSQAVLTQKLKGAGLWQSAWDTPAPRVEPVIGTKAPVRPGGTGGGLARTPHFVDNTQPSPTDGMSTFDKFAAGAGKAISNFGTGVVGALPGVDNSADVQEMRRLDAPLMDTGAGEAGNLTGQAGMMLAPGGALKGAGFVADLAGASRAAAGLDAVGGALIAPNRISTGLGVGAGTGYIQPAATPGERIMNTGIGAVAGAAVPTAVRAYKTGMSTIEPFYTGGQQDIVGRALNSAAGQDAPNVAARLEEATQPFVGPQQGVPRQTMGELVPGSVPTTSQLAGSPSMASLEQAAMATNPNVKNTLSTQLANQNGARVAVLEDVAGNDGKRQMFATDRDATAQGLYNQAFGAPLDPQAVAAAQPTFKALSDNPYIKDAVPIARKLAAGDGIPLDAGTMQGMHYLKLGLDDAIARASAPGTAAGRNTLRQMQDAQRQLVSAMEGVSPDYAAARQTYQSMSAPVNQMDVGQALIDKSVSPLDGNIKPLSFAKALTDDGTAARATGYPGATMDNTLDNETQNRLQMVLADLQRKNATTNAGKGIGSDTAQKLAYANMIDQAGIPSWLGKIPVVGSGLQVVGNVAGRAAQPLYGAANNRLQQMLAEALSDPSTVAALMRRTGPYSGNGLADILRLGLQPTVNALPAAAEAYKQ